MAFADVIRPVADDWVKVPARSSKRAYRRSGGDWGSLSELRTIARQFDDKLCY